MTGDIQRRQFRRNAARNPATGFRGDNTLPRVQPKDILSLPIPVLPKSVQERIVRRAAEIKANAKELKSTAATQLSAAKKRIEAELIGDVSFEHSMLGG